MTTISRNNSYSTQPYRDNGQPYSQKAKEEEQRLGATTPKYLCAKMPTAQQTKKITNMFMEWLVNYTKKPHRGTDIDSINKKIDFVTDIINGKSQPLPAQESRLYA